MNVNCQMTKFNSNVQSKNIERKLIFNISLYEKIQFEWIIFVQSKHCTFWIYCYMICVRNRLWTTKKNFISWNFVVKSKWSKILFVVVLIFRNSMLFLFIKLLAIVQRNKMFLLFFIFVQSFIVIVIWIFSSTTNLLINMTRFFLTLTNNDR